MLQNKNPAEICKNFLFPFRSRGVIIRNAPQAQPPVSPRPAGRRRLRGSDRSTPTGVPSHRFTRPVYPYSSPPEMQAMAKTPFSPKTKVERSAGFPGLLRFSGSDYSWFHLNSFGRLQPRRKTNARCRSRKRLGWQRNFRPGQPKPHARGNSGGIARDAPASHGAQSRRPTSSRPAANTRSF